MDKRVLSALIGLGYDDLAKSIIMALLDKGIISKEEFESIRREWQKLRRLPTKDKEEDAKGDE